MDKPKLKTNAEDREWLSLTPACPCGLCKAQQNVLNDIDTLLAERDALAEKLKDEEAAHLRTIDERDSFEDSVSETAALLGCHEEWSNMHDHRDCIPELIASATAPRKGDA